MGMMLPQKLTRQPPLSARANISNPFARGLKGLWNFANGPITPNAITGKLTTAVGTPTLAGSVFGAGFKSPSSTAAHYVNTQLLASTIGVNGNGARTVFVLARMDYTASQAGIIQLGTPGSGEDWTLRLNALSAAWRIQVWGKTSSDFSYGVDGGHVLVAMVYAPGVATKVFINGQLRSTGAGPTTLNTTDANLLIGGWTNNNNSWTQPIIVAGIANRAWSDSEAIAFTSSPDNPWQLFRAPSPSVVGDSAAPSETLGSLAWTEQDDACAITATLTNSAALAWTEADDVTAITASVISDTSGSLAWTEQDDVTVMHGATRAPEAGQASGGFYEVPQVPRRRSVKEERERLGITTREVKQIIKAVAQSTVAAVQTDVQAKLELERRLAQQDFELKALHAQQLRRERERLLARDLAVALAIRRKQQADDEDEREAEMLLMM
jgi:hypothetical protein